MYWIEADTSGVYCIRNILNRKMYIGSSKQMKHRLENHRSSLRKGKHHSMHLQRAWDKYGEANFEFFLISTTAPADLQREEQEFMDFFSPAYNASKVAYRVEHTEETRKKMSDACKAAWMRPEHRAKMALRRPPPKGCSRPPFTDEHRAKLRAAHRARHRMVEAFGRLWSLRDLADVYGVKYTTLKDRIRAGWSAEDAVLTPRGKTGPKGRTE